MNKRAQFFLLAAVIISAVVLSLGISVNRATVNREPGNFYDYSYEVQRETGAVIDYEIYSGFDDGANLSRFIDLLADDIVDKNPGANFLFVYGDTDGMKVTNYGAEDATVGGNSVPGANANAISRIYSSGKGWQKLSQAARTHDSSYGTLELGNLESEDEVVVEVLGYEYEFPVSRHRKVIFIMQKEVKDESFVTAR